MIDPALCGAIIDPAITDQVCLSLASAGKEPLFCDARPDLKGFGAGKSMLHQDSEVRIFGKTLPSWNQKRGTCTEQGTGRAFRFATLYAIDRGSQIGYSGEWSSEMLYGVARVQLGRGQFGKACPWTTPCGGQRQPPCGDGCSGALVAQAAHDFGWLPRGVYGQFDLSKPREDLAVAWSNTGTPAALLSDTGICKASACHLVKSLDELHDGIAAGCAASCCGRYATEGQRDANGAIVLTDISPGGHCESVVGVFIDIHGVRWWIVQNSWGPNGPQGGGTWKLADGREVTPAEGAAAVRDSEILKYLKSGEIWLLAAPENIPTGDLKPSQVAA